MKRFLAVAAAALCAGWLVAAAPDAPPDKKPAAPDYQDFVYLGDSRPVLIRIHIETDGRPIEAAWNDFIDRLFAHLDVNGDGVLDKEEVARAPLPQMLFNSINFGFVGAQAPLVLNVNDTDHDGKISRDELAAYYRRNGGSPVQLTASGGPAMAFSANGKVLKVGGLTGFPIAASADAVNDAFFDLLDTDKDGKISRQELAAAPEILMKLDADEDETVSLAELLPKTAQPTRPLPGGQPFDAVGAAPLLMTTPADAGDLVRRLQARYGPKDARAGVKLTRQNLGLDQKTFDRLDADKDGQLDDAELAHFAERTADVELKVRLGKRSPKEVMTEVLTNEENPSPLASGINLRDGAVGLEVGSARLVLRGVEDARPSRPDALRQQYLMQFKAADRDNNGYLDEKEAMQSPFFQSSFKAMDRDGDGKLFEKEVIAFLDAIKDLQSAASAGSVTVNFADDSRGLFDLVDLNHDGRLGLREMRQMVKLIDQLDKDGDGKISRSEIQKSCQITVRQGPAGTLGFTGPVVIATPFGVGPPTAPAATAGPLWFRKMDRNHDGDVSRKEFLGTDEEFKRLDLDGDGLISVDEAEKADAALCKAKD